MNNYIFNSLEDEKLYCCNSLNIDRNSVKHFKRKYIFGKNYNIPFSELMKDFTFPFTQSCSDQNIDVLCSQINGSFCLFDDGYFVYKCYNPLIPKKFK